MIPNYESFYNSILNFLNDKNERKVNEIVDFCVQKHQVTNEERLKNYESSGVNIVYSRVHWALTYLKMAKLIENVKKGTYKITNDGIKAMHDDIDNKYLKKYPSFIEFTKRIKKNKQRINEDSNDNSTDSPEDRMDEAYQEKKEKLISELLDTLMNNITSMQFEHLVNRLLSKMNYGIAENTKTTGDGGIDGIIKADKFGFEKIYVQAKQWKSKVSSPEIDKFSGAMDKFALSSPKGVFITTSEFTYDAEESVRQNKNKQIVLIDGRKLAELMIEYGMGVELKEEYKIYDINTDFFEDLN